YGLYSSFMGCFVYCFLGTAKDVTLGPTAIMSLLVSSYASHEPVHAVLLAFLSGCIQLAMGLLHLGFILDFISCPVIKGFTSAASITISFNQIKNILGLQGIPRQFFLQVYETLRRIGETRAGDAVLGLTCLAALAGLRAMKSHVPRAGPAEALAVRISHLIVWISGTGWQEPRPAGGSGRTKSQGCCHCAPSWGWELLSSSDSHLLPLLLPWAGFSVALSASAARNALVVLFAGLVAYSFQVMGSQPFVLTGSIPQGLPAFRPPRFSLAVPNGTVPFQSLVQDMGLGLAVVPLMGLLETIAIAKAFGPTLSQSLLVLLPVCGRCAWGSLRPTPTFLSASQNGYRIDPNQELLALGVANVLGSFVSSYPITGSFGRTAVNAQSGVCTPAGGLVTGALVLLSLAYLTSLFYYIPKAALAAVIISAVVPMFDAGIFRTLWRVKSHSPELPVTPQVSEGAVLLVQPGSSLHFPAVEHLRDCVCSRALPASPPRSVVLDCCHVSSIDYTAVLGLAELLQELHRHGLSLAFCGLKDPVLQVLLSADLEGFQHFPSREEAGEALDCSPRTG
ncbi:hypothetical protein IHE44_0006977, partial [Lamprotornis superbus]